ncbi:MAG: tetratricopeptide repeat protein [Coriobacteriales bacterium]|nr:tetratricopeptide repeat protein [Coriobacteriales bacterium]
MNSSNYSQAENAYRSGDFVAALKLYYSTLKEDSSRFAPGEMGLLYYRIGNCLLKMHTFNEAAISYQKALEDAGFTSRSAAQVNLGKAQLGLGKYEDSVLSFNAALSDTTYAKPYQALMGLGNAYTKLGLIVDAGTAYRNAALDERNPNPPKALMSLGSCFMALGRPEDAIESFNAVFEFGPQQAQAQKAYESLGQAFTAAGHYNEALDAFGRALAPGGFVLSVAAQSDYHKAMEILSANQATSSDNLAQLATPTFASATPALEPVSLPDGTEVYGAGNVPTANDTGFFDVTESDLVRLSKKQIKGQRKLRHTGLKAVLTVIILLIVLLAAAVFGYTQGYGWPMQESVINDVFAANSDGKDTTKFWIGTTDEEKQVIERIMDMVAPTSSVDVIYMDRGMSYTEVVVAAHLKEGGTVNYQISLDRDGIGWKISGFDLYFASRQ